MKHLHTYSHLLCLPLVAAICIAIPATTHAQKALATPYIAEAKKIMPTITLDDNPGDGGEVEIPKQLIFALL
jgi:hypothetical protein